MIKVISFFTEDWKYSEYAQSLVNDCERLGLPYRIEPRKNTGSYSKNTRIKPYFIRDCLMSETDNLLWVDVDGSILRYPDFLLSLHGDSDIGAKKRIDHSQDLAWHVGTLWFNNNDATRGFVDCWCDFHASTDDRSFDMATKKYDVRIRDIPPEYFFIQRKTSDKVPPDTVILHRISSGEQKLSEKYGK